MTGGRKRVCAHCGDEADMTCIGCKATVYCSREHQKSDWNIHKHFCKSFKDFQTPPSPDYYRAILLPEEKGKPHFTWVPRFEASADEQETAPNEPYARLDFSPFFDDGTSLQTSIAVLGHYTSEIGKHTDQAVYQACRATNQFDGSQPNKCLLSLCDDGSIARRYRGPIVLFGMSSLIKERRPMHISAVDFSLALKVLLQHHYKAVMSTEQCEARGVVVLNPRVAAAHKASPFGDVFVPVNHPIFEGGQKSALSKLVGMPLLTFECKAEEDHEDGDGEDAEKESDEWEISPAAFLHLHIRPNGAAATEPTFGTIPGDWQNRKGGILVVREDMMPLSASTVEALCKYSAQEAKSLLLKATESFDSRRKAVANISKADWEEYLKECELAEGVEKLRGVVRDTSKCGSRDTVLQ